MASNKFNLLMLVVFIASRWAFSLQGMEFDSSPIHHFWQHLDTAALSQNLTQSIFYLHSQPPLFNLFLGSVIGNFPDHQLQIFNATFLLLSLLSYFVLFEILTACRFNPYLAFLLSSLFMVLPEVVLYENWLFYTWPVACFLLGASYFLLKYEQSSKTKYAIGFILAISAVCLTRSLFHIVYFAAAILVLFLVNGSLKKAVKVYGLIALIVVSSVYVKNLIVFDFFGTSSWTGMTLWGMAHGKDGERPIRANARNPISWIKPFQRIGVYPPSYRSVPDRFSEIEVLNNRAKTNHNPNFNHYGYISLSKAYGAEAVKLIKKRPRRYLRRVLGAWTTYFEPSWDNFLLAESRKPIQPYIDALDPLGPHKRSRRGRPRSRSLPLAIPLATASTVIYGARILARRVSRGKGAPPQHFYLFVVMTIVYTAVVGNSLEIGENNRFRVVTDPLLYLGTLILLRNLFIELRLLAAPRLRRLVRRA